MRFAYIIDVRNARVNPPKHELADLLADLQERFRELKAEVKDDETGFAMTIVY